MPDLEVLLPLEKRDEVRRRVLAEAPRWYNPWVHVAIPSIFGFATIVTALSLLEHPVGWYWLTVPITYLLTNMNEWFIHRDILHHRFPLAPILYDRHTPEHHMIYVTDDMEIRDWREFHLVLIPLYGLFLIFVTLLPINAFLWWLGLHDVALLYTATAMGYAVSYEWLHLSYHLPRDSWIGQLSVIQTLRRHHGVHHDPRLMQRWNFNVTLPFWDWVMRTSVPDVPAALALAEERRARRAVRTA